MQIKWVAVIDTLDQSHFLNLPFVAKASTDKPQLTGSSQHHYVVGTHIPVWLHNLLKVTELVNGLKEHLNSVGLILKPVLFTTKKASSVWFFPNNKSDSAHPFCHVWDCCYLRKYTRSSAHHQGKTDVTAAFKNSQSCVVKRARSKVLRGNL